MAIAQKKNEKALDLNENAKEYHSHIQTLLGKCYLEYDNYEDALEILE